jgi:metallophosphoesterase superfamily enzyme
MGPIAGAVDIEAAGEVLTLLPQRALFWPAMSMLVIADIHFGKAASFRAQGIPGPRVKNVLLRRLTARR